MTDEDKPKAQWQPGQTPEGADNKSLPEKKDTQEKQPEELKINVKVECESGNQNASSPQPDVQTAPSNSVDPSVVLYEKGCCGAAWEDIRNTKGWFGKVCLLALIRFVPILNWVISGYALRWSRQLFFGKVESAPSKIFAERVFVNGAMWFLVSLVAGIVTTTATFIFDFLPPFGVFVSIAFSIFVEMIMNLCYVRMAIFDQLGEGFAIDKGFGGVKREFGKALSVEVFPSLFTGLIACAILVVMFFVFFCINGPSLYNQIMNLVNQYSSTKAFEYSLQNDYHLQLQLINLILVNIVAALPWLIVTCFFINICMVTCALIKYRAAGHFVTRYCSEWSNEPKFYTVLQYEEPKNSDFRNS